MVWCRAEEDEELRKAVELSLQDIGKFELSVSNNLNSDASTAVVDDDDNVGDDDDNVDEADNVDDEVDETAVDQYLNFTADDFLSSNAFGVIKDVRVNNIVASDTDKISEFDTKNFKQLLNHSDAAAACVAMLMGGASDA